MSDNNQTKKDNFSESLNLPKTEFPMRANLPVREKEILQNWQDADIYNARQSHAKGKPTYILHDGPPFANGDIHLGHSLNKILKDIVLKYKYMTGFSTPYIPGWDTHGLPIETQAIKKLKVNKEDVSKADFREICKDFALKYVDNQREQFKRLGVLADWEHPYLTLQPEYEAAQMRVFGEMVNNDLIYRGLKPVYWCADCETALAEAEIEYNDDKTDTIFVKFNVSDDKGLGIADCKFVIWTTTTWTLPGNVAIAINPNYEYVIVNANDEKLIMAAEMVETVMKDCGIVDYTLGKSFKGEQLELVECQHPFLDRTSLVILGEHVTLEAGTGCVHTAPGFGAEDYIVCKNYPQLPMVVSVDAKGIQTEDAGEFAGQYYAKSNKTIKQKLIDTGALLSSAEIMHSYPHCWRCHSPILFRATKQWFASIDDFKQKALEEIKKVKWVPKWGEERISNMVSERADWCISRQRLWGMPIPVFYCKECNHPVLQKDVIDNIADIFAKEGSNAWFIKDASDLLPSGFKCPECGHEHFKKETDTMDVWFDSGSSHAGVLDAREGLDSPADMYLEGNDQYRGWFQSSLLTSVATKGVAPYKEVLTHGFTTDGQGRKMSKSLGNGVDPLKVIEQFGADILRLWVVSADYKSDMKYSPEIVKQLTEIYRKIRNTARYILGNLYDFNPAADSVDIKDMEELDKWALHKLNIVVNKVKSAYESYDYHIVYHAIHNFCTVDLSNFYLDIIKDRLYTEKSNSPKRRSSQTAMYTIINSLVRMISPILSFTAEEIWQYIPNDDSKGEKEISSLFLQMPTATDSILTDDQVAKWDKILDLREKVAKVLEQARADKVIGNALEANVTITCDGEMLEFVSTIKDELETLFIVSGVDVKTGEFDIKVDKFDGVKCPRCWIYHNDSNNGDLCDRCARVVEG
ncbi:MAG: isoleucine--tRNA ligase [Clostridiales bacterium]|nr:isoleucine--tRNA ligase [Clostridiales bacterium]